MPLPERAFDACIWPAKVDKYQTVHFDRNRYSVPRPHAYATVTVKGMRHHIEALAGARRWPGRRCSDGQHEQILEPLHYLASLGRRPACWIMPTFSGIGTCQPCSARCAKAWNTGTAPRQARGNSSGILQLLAEHPLERVVQAIELSRRENGYACFRRVLAVRAAWPNAVTLVCH